MRGIQEDTSAFNTFFQSGKFSHSRRVLTGNITLTTNGPLVNFFDPSGATRDCTLPVLEDGRFYVVSNVGTGIINVRSAGGALVTSLTPGDTALMFASRSEWTALRGWAALGVFTNTVNGLVPAPNSGVPGSLFLRDDGQWGQVQVTGIVDAFKFITDGTNTAVGAGPDTFRFRSSTGKIGATVTNNEAVFGDNVNLTVNEASVNHNALLNYVANQHIDHTAVSVSAGVGMSGGGTIAANRTLDFVPHNLSVNGAPVLADYAVMDLAAGGPRTTLWSSVNAILNHNSLLNYVADQHVAHSGVSIVAGTGLTGGGDITTSRTLSLSISGLTVDTPAILDSIAFFDVSGGDTNKTTFSVLNGILDHNSLLNYVANEHINHTAVTITGTGNLTGGGTIAASRTLDTVAAPTFAGLVTAANFTAGASSVNSFGDIYAIRDATHGVVCFGSSGGQYLYYDGAQFNFAGGPILSPALSGSPTAPTAALGDASTLIATTDFVHKNSLWPTRVNAAVSFDTLVDAGAYFTEILVTNGPVASTQYYVLVQRYPAGSGYVQQTAWDLTASGGVWTRNQAAGSWTPWVRMADRPTSVWLTPTNDNIIGGSLAGSSLTTSASNILIGKNAGKLITGGTGENVVIGGVAAGQAITTGTQNTIVGSEAGGMITADTGHTLIGYQAGLTLNGGGLNWNTFVGHTAGFLATGAGSCVAFGRAAGRGFLNDVACAAIGHAAFYYNNGGVCSSVTALGGQAAGAPVDGTGTNWQGTGLTYWGAINDTKVSYLGDLSGKSSAAARSNATALGPLARLPLKDNVVVLGHGATAVETAGRVWESMNGVTVNNNAGVTLTAAQMLTGIITRTGTLAGAFNDTTATAAAIVAAANGPGLNCEVPCSLDMIYQNNTTQTATLVAGTGITFTGGTGIPSFNSVRYLIIVTNSTSGSEAATLYRAS